MVIRCARWSGVEWSVYRAVACTPEGKYTTWGKKRSSWKNKLKLVVEWEALSDVDGNQDGKQRNDFVKTLMNVYYTPTCAQILCANLY